MPLYLFAHYRHISDPDDWLSHHGIQRAIAHFLIARALGNAIAGAGLSAHVEAPLKASPIPSELQQEILNAPVPMEHYEQMDVAELGRKASEDLWGEPFSDCGNRRVLRWRALGITWVVRCDNDIATIPHAEAFVAVLQIALAALAKVDLCLLPTSLHVELSVQEDRPFSIKQTPDNERIAFDIRLPKPPDAQSGDLTETHRHATSTATAMLIACSCLPDPKVEQAIRTASKGGLLSKTFLVRPYSELFREFIAVSEFDSYRRRQFAKLQLQFAPRESPELKWMDGPGIGYSRSKAEKFLANRYSRPLAPLRRTLPILRQSARFQEWVRQQKLEGLLDWQILLHIMNAVMQFRVERLGGGNDPAALKQMSNDLLNREETDQDPPFPEDRLYRPETAAVRMFNLAANARTWDLIVRSQTPDFSALKRLLDVRFHQADDDIEHTEMFAPAV